MIYRLLHCLLDFTMMSYCLLYCLLDFTMMSYRLLYCLLDFTMMSYRLLYCLLLYHDELPLTVLFIRLPWWVTAYCTVY